MTIPLVEESPEIFKETGRYERCYFCSSTTTTWHENTNNPVCETCAKTHKVAELPDYGKSIRAAKRRGDK